MGSGMIRVGTIQYNSIVVNKPGLPVLSRFEGQEEFVGKRLERKKKGEISSIGVIVLNRPAEGNKGLGARGDIAYQRLCQGSVQAVIQSPGYVR